MTSRADRLRSAGEAGDAAGIRDLLTDLPEADRIELQPVAREIVAAGMKQGIGADVKPMLLVAYGVLPIAEIRKLGWRSNYLPKDAADVLRRRAPDRLGPIVAYLLDDFTGWSWRTIRPLVREGIVPRPDRPSYTIAMLAATRYAGAAELVAGDPGLLDIEAWRLFEVEGGGEDSLANHEKFFGDRWGEVFRDHAARDPVVRARLLDASLAALARDFAQYRAGWFSRFHESLAPTDEERAARVPAYLALLRSRVGPTVSMAVAALGRVQAAGGLPADDLLDRVGPVLVDGSAGTAKSGLGLVGRAGAASSNMGRRAAIVASDALAHASPEVQRAAIELIGRLVQAPDEALTRAVADRLPEVAASQRPAASALLARLGAGEAVATPVAAPADRPVAAAATRTSPTDPDRRIEPIASIDSLVDVAVSVLETGEPADDIERILEAVGRFGGDRPGDFGRLTAPIARRARTILGRRESSPFGGSDARADVAAVLLAWAAGEVAGPDQPNPSADGAVGNFLSARAHEVAVAAAAGRTFRSVALPTHRGGWIDPGVLVARLAAGEPPSILDLVAAVLRLAPEGREAALGPAADVAGEAGAVARYALGGDEPIGPTAPWWVAAARVRAPGVDDLTVEQRHPGLGPNAGRAARVKLRTGPSRAYVGGLTLDIEPPLPGSTSVALPTVLMLRAPSSFAWTGRSETAMFRWMATIQPGDREPWAATGSLLLARNIDWWSAEWANRAYLEPFIDPATAIGPHARALLGIALGAKEAGERGLATDVVGLALADGRLTASGLAEGLTAAAAVACDRPIRWARSLADVAEVSSEHASAVVAAIGQTLPAVAERPTGTLVPLLRLFDELSAATGSSPDVAARPILERFAAGGPGSQAGRLARSILARA